MRYHNITKDDMLNGDGLQGGSLGVGLRALLQGMPESHNLGSEGGLPFDEAARREIFQQLDKPYISGITFPEGIPPSGQ